MKTIEGFDVKIFTDNVEAAAVKQIRELLSIDVFADKKIRIMPDVHAGAGCVIGFTGDLGDKVIPNIVGVDIGCGMRVLKLGKVNKINFHAFQKHILANVPSGYDVREEKQGFNQLVGKEMDIYNEARKLVSQMHCYRELKTKDRINKSIGSLGGGNHFIELDRDKSGNVYLVIHTGSRNLGKQVAEIYQARAVRHHTKGGDEFKKLPKPLCYVEGEDREQYLHDMRLCQRWSSLNRELIGILLMKFFNNIDVQEEFETIHNYISDDNIIRKGAISATRGERCIIPLNMRDGSLICVGKGNPDWNCSAPHGAGRILSRAQAYKKISMNEFKASMKGIYSESVNDFTRDESPMAYKPAKEIIANIGDTVSIESIIRPIFNFKATK